MSCTLCSDFGAGSRGLVPLVELLLRSPTWLISSHNSRRGYTTCRIAPCDGGCERVIESRALKTITHFDISFFKGAAPAVCAKDFKLNAPDLL